MTQKEWKKIEGYEDRYLISKNGAILSLKPRWNTSSKIIRKLFINHGYNVITLQGNGLKPKMYRVARLVAKSFVENPNNLPFVNHKDGNKLNDNYKNLEWCTASDNLKHAFRFGLKSASGEKNSQSKLTINDINSIRNSSENQYVLAKRFNVDQSNISYIKNGKRWTS